MPKNTGSTPAICGGPKVRSQGMPKRLAYGQEELHAVTEVFEYYRSIGEDFGYQGHYEELYSKQFVAFQEVDEGYADAVCTGSASVFLALAALQLPRGAEVIVSPITDPGAISAVILNQLTPVLADSVKGSYNISADSIAKNITPKTKAVLVTHAVGQACQMDDIMVVGKDQSVFIVEDCSQAHGARFTGRRVGTFGEIAAFSTMYRKNHGTGGCGGVVFTQNRERYRLAMAYADRGKPKWLPHFQEKDPSQFLFPALNFNQDELSCAIGMRTLKKLSGVNAQRLAFVSALTKLVKEETRFCRVYPMTENDAPFFLPVFIDTEKLKCSKLEFAKAVEAEGIILNPHYAYVVSEWPWVWPHLSGSRDTPNAVACRDCSFNILFNEQYGQKEVEDIVATLIKLESYYLR